VALNEVLLGNYKVVGEDGVLLGQPRNLKERAEKEVRGAYFLVDC
jgi:hypothetical protein